MSYDTLSRIESIGSDGSADLGLGTLDSTSALVVNTTQPSGRVGFQPEENESTVPGDGFAATVGAHFLDGRDNAKEACRGSCCSKVKGFFMFITIPFYIVLKPFLDSRVTRRKVTHHGIIYFYIIMFSTIIFNLWEQRVRKDSHSVSYKFLQYFEAAIMLLALIAMLYIAVITIGKVDFADHEKNLILYFRTGLYVFGVASMVHTALSIFNYCSCPDALNITVNIAKFLFIVGQILFLNYFYQAKLPSGGWSIQVSLAHILSTNLSLWIWTVCKEVYDPELHDQEVKNCKFPISLNHTEKYFYPLFIEYLLLVASMVYELWMDLKISPDARRRDLARHHWGSEVFQEELQNGSSLGYANNTGVSHPIRLVVARRRRKFTPSLAFSFVLGLVFSSIFLSFILASNDSESKDTPSRWYKYFVFANICFYFTQLVACYVIKVCSQSQPANRKRSSLNLDDILLYFGLAGIMLWEGFHFYTLFFDSDQKIVFFAHGLLGMIEDVAQTVILVSVRRLSSREDKNSKAITSMSLFLLATNLTFWVQNSFYIGKELRNPGEPNNPFLDIFGDILNPIIIFFRFHSATCCYQMWIIFSDAVIIDN